MAVALDATGTLKSTPQAPTTSISYTGITVGSGTNRALLFVVCFNTRTVSGLSATWDSGGTNQAMTLISFVQAASGSFAAIAIFGLVAPTTGNKTLACSWTTSSEYASAAISFTGVDQTGGSTSFPHANNAAGTSTLASVTVTSQTGNYVLAAHQTYGAALFGTVNQTQLFLEHNLSNTDNASNYSAGAASVTMSVTVASSDIWISSGIDILAAGAGAAFIAASQKPILQAVKRAAYW